MPPGAAIVVASLAWATPGHAEPPSAKDKDTVAALRAEGDALSNQGRLDKAIEAWRKAWALRPDQASVACNLGRAELRRKNLLEAAEWLSRCVRLAPLAEGPNALKRRSQEVLELAYVRERVASVSMKTEQDALLSVDDRPLGKAPLAEEVFVMPGKHRVHASIGARQASVELDAKAGGKHAVELVLSEKAPPKDPGSALAPTRGKEPPAPGPSPEAPSFRGWPIAVSGGLSATALGLGIAFTVVANTAESEANQHRITIRERTEDRCKDLSNDPLCPVLGQREGVRVDFRNAATGVFIASGVLFGATLGYLAYEQHRVRITPTVGGVVGRYVW